VTGGTIGLDRTLGAVYQDPASYMTPSMAVGRQLGEVLRVRGGLGRRRARARALELLAEVGLPARVYRQRPAELSGGMQQRAMLAIALSCDPDLLVADEPTSALDVKTQAEIVALLQQRRELALLFVSHDLEIVEELCDRVATFERGTLAA
jgi:ABC-type glutathione transport system ATPase component